MDKIEFCLSQKLLLYEILSPELTFVSRKSLMSMKYGAPYPKQFQWYVCNYTNTYTSVSKKKLNIAVRRCPMLIDYKMDSQTYTGRKRLWQGSLWRDNVYYEIWSLKWSLGFGTFCNGLWTSVYILLVGLGAASPPAYVPQYWYYRANLAPTLTWVDALNKSQWTSLMHCLPENCGKIWKSVYSTWN